MHPFAFVIPHSEKFISSISSVVALLCKFARTPLSAGFDLERMRGCMPRACRVCSTCVPTSRSYGTLLYVKLCDRGNNFFHKRVPYSLFNSWLSASFNLWLRFCCLQRIDLRDNNIQISGLIALLESLAVSPSVIRLDLDKTCRRWNTTVSFPIIILSV